MDKILYGTAYYYEYLPYDRLEKDIAMMKKANINLVRIGESTWSTYELQDGIFDFSPLDKVLDAMNKANISVIVGTPTYAFPTWLVKKYPEIMVTTKDGQKKYGSRQIMDITNPVFLKYSKRIIKKMIKHVANHPAVIGYQIDNETKHYGTSSENVQNLP
ncbi:beta-galactosidase [Clostridium guangxiense]|uniref:beta-galactosidase n=1 Tax=Clostridium guangxiense TaxID=1662055 RepID=UPI001E5DACAC|nr:beta-galactosidase [Clostridium guangxiense]